MVRCCSKHDWALKLLGLSKHSKLHGLFVQLIKQIYGVQLHQDQMSPALVLHQPGTVTAIGISLLPDPASELVPYESPIRLEAPVASHPQPPHGLSSLLPSLHKKPRHSGSQGSGLHLQPEYQVVLHG